MRKYWQVNVIQNAEDDKKLTNYNLTYKRTESGNTVLYFLI